MNLTKREKEVLTMLCLTKLEIADRLEISINTVGTHIQHLLNKFPEADNRQKIIIEALKQGVLTIDELITE